MPRMFVSNKDESIRIFENPMLNVLSYVHWSYPLIFWLPIVGYCLFKAVTLESMGFVRLIAAFAGGLVFWTFSEYALHRWVFHYEPSSAWGQRIHFLMHGVHHDYPNDARRLVMPPLLALVLVLPFYALLRVALGSGSVFFCAFAGFLIGYLAYDMIHYALHHSRSTHPLWIKLKQHHMVHHYKDPARGFGVSSMFWDMAFGTSFPQEEKGA